MKINKGYEILHIADSLEFYDSSNWHAKDSSDDGWADWFGANDVGTSASELMLDFAFPVGHSVPTCSR